METPPTAWNPDELTTHAEWIRGLALHLVRDAARADDLVQETFLAALERRPASGRSLKPWLRRVLQKRFAYRVRSDARRRAREVEGAVEEALPPSDSLVESAEAHARLVRELTQLREPYRTALLLRYFEGKSPQEIAERQGLPAATVRSHLKRGLDELRERLDRRDGGESRTWALTLIPLAAASRDAKLAGGLLSTLTQGVRAMNPLTQTLVGSTVLLAAAAFVARQIDFAPPGGGGGTPPVHETTGETSNAASHASPVAPSSAGVASTSGESSSTDSNPRESVIPESTWLVPASEDEKITGVVVDKATGTPLPDFALSLHAYTLDQDEKMVFDPAGAEELSTDEEGHFETERAYAAGTTLTRSMRGDPLSCQVNRSKYPTTSSAFGGSGSLTWDPAEAPLEFQVALGPTYRLALTGPVDWHTDKLHVSLSGSEEEPYDVLESCSLLLASVRGISSPYVSFVRFRRSFPEDRPWILRVETPDGLLGGEARRRSCPSDR